MIGHQQLTAVIKWAALCLTLSGAVLTSWAIDPINIIILNLGCLLYMWWASRVRDLNLFLLNSTLLLIYLAGIITRHA